MLSCLVLTEKLLKIKQNTCLLNELKKLKTVDLGYFIGKSHFQEDGTQNYLVFQSLNKYFKIGNSDYVLSQKSKGSSSESIAPPSAPNNFLNPSLNYLDAKIRVRFRESCLKQLKMSYTHGKVANIYIVYEINKKDSTTNIDPTLENCLFGAVTLTKNVNIDKYGYSGYGIGFDGRSSFSFSGGGFGQKVLIFGADMSSSAHIENNKKDISVLGKGTTQGLEHMLTAEKMYSIGFTE